MGSITPPSAAPCACSKAKAPRCATVTWGSANRAFWQHESYDHVVRNEREYERILAYIVNNPVKAGLVSDWQEWPYTFVVGQLLCRTTYEQLTYKE